MDFWSDLQNAADSVRMGDERPEEPAGFSNLPPHVKQHLLGPNSKSASPSSGNPRDPAFRNLPDHLKNNPYNHLSRKELMELYEEMKNDPNAYKVPTQNIDEQMKQKAAKDGKPYIDPEGGATIQPQKGFVLKTKDQNNQKIFINMVSHELVDAPEEKHIPDSDQPAVRIPMSVGNIREDFDKKGSPCQVIDVIWNPETIKKARKEPLYKQGLAELSFEYIKEKHGLELNMRFTQPNNLKYKGKTVQWQRIRAKKNPKIEQLNSKPLSEEEQQKIQNENFAKVKEQAFLAQHKADWKLYCIHKQLKNVIFDSSWWEKQILIDKLEILPDPDAQDEEEKDDQIDQFMDIDFSSNFELVEEYDGLNENFAFYVVLVKLQMLMRGHSIKIITQGKKININL